MSLQNHSYYFEEYPLLAIVPIGKKNKRIRSIGHKTERAFLERFQETLRELSLQTAQKQQIQRFLSLETEAYFPLFFTSEEKLLPTILKPEHILWTYFSPQHGIPLKSEWMYPVDLTTLSRPKMKEFLKSALEEYTFCANLSFLSKEDWVNKIVDAYHNHPFVQLAEQKKTVVNSVENMNRSSLLSLLSPPEDVAFWRQRVDIIMRPYRMMPVWCHHEKNLTPRYVDQAIQCECVECGKVWIYDVESGKITFEGDPPFEQAVKRIHTVERQFNELAEKNGEIILTLFKLSHIKKLPLINQSMSLLSQRDSLPTQQHYSEQVDETLVLELFHSKVPASPHPSYLLWMSQFSLPSLNVFGRLRETSLDQVEKEIQQTIETLKDQIEQFHIEKKEISFSINHLPVTYQEILGILNGIQSLTNHPIHVLTKLLSGGTSSSIRKQSLDQSSIFGLFSTLTERDCFKLLKKLEQMEWITKDRKGYRVSEKGEKLLTYFR
ncbi:hypothetical protein Q73_14480 [Bacillus coahuilensis m2-6]|uniref:RQC-minor-2 family DNA-binding protein n=1 Tax=Bacillus coahuilensis TaxID=408580 RepID=UPI0007506DDB|nr:RQC-minor-2 family DNA-binding protein [Bacillus coahuilensis]KUP04835.1 hypothetical protein Q73_14480 [Bacillus coahuilensis m2-6]